MRFATKFQHYRLFVGQYNFVWIDVGVFVAYLGLVLKYYVQASGIMLLDAVRT